MSWPGWGGVGLGFWDVPPGPPVPPGVSGGWDWVEVEVEVGGGGRGWCVIM